ncbi:retrovirus-related pol polyprotein from transposon TNT 1-94 [Tanacetum coccineum]
MDAKTAFLNGSLKEEVYVSQREGFIDPEFPDHVYRLKKALYGLKQAPHAWYDKLSSFLIEHGFTKGIVDPTLFTRRHGDDILLVQMRTQLLDYGYKYNRILMYCDSKSAIAISCNPVQHSKTKHIDIRYHFIKEHVEKGTVELYFVGTEYQLADLFTKALPKEHFEYLVHRIALLLLTQYLGSYGTILAFKCVLLVTDSIAIWLALQMKFETLQVPQTTCRTFSVHPRDQNDPYDDAPPEGENSAKRQKTSEYEAYVTGESSGQVNESEQSPSSLGNQEQVDDYDFWTESYTLDDDEIPTKQVSQYIMEEVLPTLNEVELKKIADEMLRQRCTSGDEHQYHIDQMKNFLKSDIVWESRKEILASPHPRKTTPLVQSWPEKIVLSLHKFPVIIFNDVDIKEQTSRWRQKELGKPKEVVYLNSKIIQVIKTYWELGHEHKFITEIVTRRANEYIVSITESDYKNLNKNDINDIYLLIMNGKVHDYAKIGLMWSLSVFIRSSVIWERVHDFQLGIESYQQKVNLTAPTISFPRIKKHKMFSIIYEPMHGIIYKNSKKEKRVMRHSKIHKFCDATLNRVLEGLKSYNNDVKYGYIQRDLTEDEVEYLKLFEEEIEQFWFTVTKIKKSSSYQFQLDDQKFQIDVELFWKILRIYPRVSKKEFVRPPHDSLVTFIKQLGYKGSLDMISDMLKFISKGEPTQVYGISISDVMLNDDIKNSKVYQTYLTLSTGTKPPNKGRGKGKGLMSQNAATSAPEKKKSESMSLTEAEIAEEERRKKKMKGIATDSAAQELLNLKKGIKKCREDYILQQIPKGLSEESSSKPKVPDEPKGKSTGSSEGESDKVDDETSDEEEMHTDEEEHADDETADDEEEVHEDEEMHDADEVHAD